MKKSPLFLAALCLLSFACSDVRNSADAALSNKGAAPANSPTIDPANPRAEQARARAQAAGKQDVPTKSIAEEAIALHDEGHTDLAKPLLTTAAEKMLAAGEAAHTVTTTTSQGWVRKLSKPNQLFVSVVTRLGWVSFDRSIEHDEATLYEVEGAAAFEEAWQAIDPACHAAKLYPPETAERLRALSRASLGELSRLKIQDHIDGFAIKARLAWFRFRNANSSSVRWDREKGRRSFCPAAMRREDDVFSDIWTWQYRKPFVVFIERPFDAANQQRIDEALNLLGQFADWFDQNMIRPWGLKRVKPEGYAEQADAEGWPLPVVIFAGKASFQAYLDEVQDRPGDGRLGYFSPFDELVAMCLPDAVDQALFEANLVRQSFHMLYDFYAAAPHFADEEGRRTRPRFSSLLAMQGPPDLLAGISRQGSGADATYTFMQVNKPELREFKRIYAELDNNVLFTLKDIAGLTSWTRSRELANDNADRMGKRIARGNFSDSACMATACQAAYFFQHFQKGGRHVYRDQWWAFIRAECEGKHTLSGFGDTTALEKFEQALGITDWDALQAEFLEFTLALKTE